MEKKLGKGQRFQYKVH